MKKKVLAVLMTGVLAASVMMSTAAFADETESAGVSLEDVGGFTENPIWSDAELGPEGGDPFIHMNGVWFQAVPMSGGYEDIGDNNIHIEADIAAEANDLGFGVGDWIPYLTVAYDITDSETGDSVASGNFMPMSASDGPHYGANISLEAGTYDFTVSVSPQEDVYLIHLDSETGPGGNWDEVFGDGALTYTYEGWEFAGYEQ